MVTTLWVLMSLTIWMGEELVVDAVNAYPTEKECRTALEQRARQVAALPHCCGGGANLRCIPWSGQELKPHTGPYMQTVPPGHSGSRTIEKCKSETADASSCF